MKTDYLLYIRADDTKSHFKQYESCIWKVKEFTKLNLKVKDSQRSSPVNSKITVSRFLIFSFKDWAEISPHSTSFVNFLCLICSASVQKKDWGMKLCAFLLIAVCCYHGSWQRQNDWHWLLHKQQTSSQQWIYICPIQGIWLEAVFNSADHEYETFKNYLEDSDWWASGKPEWMLVSLCSWHVSISRTETRLTEEKAENRNTFLNIELHCLKMLNST